MDLTARNCGALSVITSLALIAGLFGTTDSCVRVSAWLSSDVVSCELVCVKVSSTVVLEHMSNE